MPGLKFILLLVVCSQWFCCDSAVLSDIFWPFMLFPDSLAQNSKGLCCYLPCQCNIHPLILMWSWLGGSSIFFTATTLCILNFGLIHLVAPISFPSEATPITFHLKIVLQQHIFGVIVDQGLSQSGISFFCFVYPSYISWAHTPGGDHFLSKWDQILKPFKGSPRLQIMQMLVLGWYFCDKNYCPLMTCLQTFYIPDILKECKIFWVVHVFIWGQVLNKLIVQSFKQIRCRVFLILVEFPSKKNAPRTFHCLLL